MHEINTYFNYVLEILYALTNCLNLTGSVSTSTLTPLTIRLEDDMVTLIRFRKTTLSNNTATKYSQPQHKHSYTVTIRITRLTSTASL